VPGYRIQAYCRLIEKQNRRAMQRRLRNLQPPDHASGVFTNQDAGRLTQAHELESLVDALPAETARNAVKPRKQQKVLIPGEPAIGGKHL
jgi:hypothetical protein